MKLTEANGWHEKQRSIKCVVWDLDNTLWDGILSEDETVRVREEVIGIIKTLDSRGLLNSIASKNDHEQAINKLREFNLEEYFIHPQINWDSKAASIESLAKLVNISLDSIAFIDDQPFERAEVAFRLPEVLCIDAASWPTLLAMPEMNPTFLTEDSALRRMTYLNDVKRKRAEEEFSGPQDDFLATLDLCLTISRARENDLVRMQELMLRTNQLNATGYTYSLEELLHFCQSEEHRILLAELQDKFGMYGKIALVLVECQEKKWTIKLLLTSCRVMSRGVGAILLNYVMILAKAAEVTLQAEFVPNDRNRIMFITYKFAGFREVANRGNCVILEGDPAKTQRFPHYMKIHIADDTQGYLEQ